MCACHMQSMWGTAAVPQSEEAPQPTHLALQVAAVARCWLGPLLRGRGSMRRVLVLGRRQRHEERQAQLLQQHDVHVASKLAPGCHATQVHVRRLWKACVALPAARQQVHDAAQHRPECR